MLIKVKGLELSVEYELDGKYHPPTRWEQEEYPDIIINHVSYADDNILDVIDCNITYEEIVDAVAERLSEDCFDEGYGDYLYEQWKEKMMMEDYDDYDDEFNTRD